MTQNFFTQRKPKEEVIKQKKTLCHFHLLVEAVPKKFLLKAKQRDDQQSMAVLPIDAVPIDAVPCGFCWPLETHGPR